MKKSVMLMAGFLAMALAGSAQAATCNGCAFAVQDSGGTNDNFTVDPSGLVNAGGQPLVLGGGLAMGLSKAPGTATLTAGTGPYHLVSGGMVGPTATGRDYLTASGVMQHTANPISAVNQTFDVFNAPNFSFYRVNQLDNGTYSLPGNFNALGYLNFGTLDLLQDPAAAGTTYKKNLVQILVRAEADAVANPTAWQSVNNTPANIAFITTHWTGTANTRTIKLMITADGKTGINTATPTSKLQVVGLPVCPDNTTAKATVLSGGCGLTNGAFYLLGPVVGIQGGSGVTVTSGALQVAF
jgi:hypothetical protein